MKSRPRSRRTLRRRTLLIERLDRRELLAADIGCLHNPIDPFDVDDDGLVAPLDALMVVNELNTAAEQVAGENTSSEPSGIGFFDVNADQQISPLDALMVMNELNRPGRTGGAEGNSRPPGPEPQPTGFRSIDGTDNNSQNSEWGSTGVQLLRISPADYADGIDSPAGADRPSAREISNAVSAQSEDLLNDRHLSDFVYVWGQFLDHDIDHTAGTSPAEPFNIAVPADDPYFDPLGTGTQEIRLNRSEYDPTTGTDAENPRQQINRITAWIDGSVVYGSDAERAAALRTFEGGRLKTSEGDLLPFNTLLLPNDNDAHRVPDEELFLAGDVRANENIELTSIHTLFVREHNRIAEQIAGDHPELSDEEIYQQARQIVGAEIQAITYNEFLPALLGEEAIRPYAGYRSDVNPGISNEFSTAAYRFGHSLLADDVEFFDNDGQPIREEIPLSEAFFNPEILAETGIDPLIKYLATENAQEVDTQLVDSVRNFLFGPPGAGGLDLAALNIQRGRDHGLADYNTVREAYGLPRVESFAEITSDPELQQTLEDLYGDVDDIDLWVGGLAEDHVRGSSVGPTFQRILVDQFTRLRDADRYWYQQALSPEQVREIDNTTLADIIRRNTEITNLQDNVFFDPSVLYFEAPAGSRGVDLAVVVTDDTLQLIDHRNDEVLEMRPLEEVSRVILVGSPGDDRVLVDLGTGQQVLPGGVIVHGMRGLDELVVRGTSEVDSFQVDRDGITANGQMIELARVESVRIDTGAGDDDVQVAGRLPFRLTIDGRTDREPRPDQQAVPGPDAIAPDTERPSRGERRQPGGRTASPREQAFAAIAVTPQAAPTGAGRGTRPAGETADEIDELFSRGDPSALDPTMVNLDLDSLR